ncbi:hypothetical protein T02_6142 [Trichinella nativa]|uniref:Uncharacterized protein n=1 Tax=Trichinella nativa TaxID=6335 RepID=A0A0V1KKQ7_9BILA|nr:hypothetical protein T02_6142 [Trichinella nativa]
MIRCFSLICHKMLLLGYIVKVFNLSIFNLYKQKMSPVDAAGLIFTQQQIIHLIPSATHSENCFTANTYRLSNLESNYFCSANVFIQAYHDIQFDLMRSNLMILRSNEILM